ncbi:MAG: hypothetical protein B6A08_08595 [Sorangiineae bacterium NIC37A_2]|jgi:predicted esterase|nr:MAG: hypothetical protein B6A08_08595 [Sorangiineae bacterium NIC37A_2]
MDRIAKCREHGLAYDPTRSQGCVLCRRSIPVSQKPGASGMAWLVSAIMLGGLLVLGVVRFRRGAAGLSGLAAAVEAAQVPTDGTIEKEETEVPARALAQGDAKKGRRARGEEVWGEIQHRNSAGRSGAFFLPPSSYERVPLLVALHGTGSNGRAMIGEFQSLALDRGFALLGPDSRVSPAGDWTWQVADQPNERTPDFWHIHACLDELMDRYGDRLKAENVLIVGHSGGGSTAPYLATNSSPFSAFAVLHGGVFAGGLGPRQVRGWFSTGREDNMRPPSLVRAAAAQARSSGLRDIEYREFPGGHGLGEEERRALVNWWLGESALHSPGGQALSSGEL